MPVQLGEPSTAMRCQIVGRSSTAISARISTNDGMHITTSISRLSSMSTHPPK